MANLCPGLLWAILWFLALLIIGWPVAFFVTWFYMLMQPFFACIEGLKGVAEAMLKLVQLPYTFADNMMHMKACGG